MREGEELRFTVSELTYTATSMVKAEPSARVVQARALFVPASAERGATIYTAWASSVAPGGLQCVPTPCEQAGRLAFDCPAPKCEVTGSELELDSLDQAIIGSLRLR